MKFTFKWVIVLILVSVVTVPARAWLPDIYDATVNYLNLSVYEYGDERIAVVTGYDGTVSTLTIPAYVPLKGKIIDIVGIDEQAFKDNTTLTSVDCSAIQYDHQSLLCDWTRTGIGEEAFSGCTNLSTVTFPSLTENTGKSGEVLYIGDRAFKNCSKLGTGSTLTISEALIGEEAFYGTAFDNVSFYTCGMLSVGDRAFANSSVTTAGFACYLSDFENESFPADAFGDGIFQNCSKLTTVVIADNKLQRIPDNTFYRCVALSDIQFYYDFLGMPSVLTEIGNCAFYQCRQVSTLTLPEGVKTLGYQAFNGCTYLSSVKLPSTLTSLASNSSGVAATFGDNYNIQTVTCDAITPPAVSTDDVFYSGIYSSARLKVPTASISKYKAATMWKNFSTYDGDTTRGDLNGDGSIDGSDVSILLEMVLAGGVTDNQKAVADLNDDGSVDGSDVSILLEMVLAGE